MSTVPGIADLGLFRVIGQPNLEFTVDRDQAARYGINVADVQDAIETAVGGKAVSQVLQGEAALRPGGALSGPVPRHTGGHREHPHPRAHRRACLAGAALRASRVTDGASEIYREGNSRYVAIKYSVRGPRPGQHGGRGHVEGGAAVKLPPGYHIDWAGEYESQKRS